MEEPSSSKRLRRVNLLGDWGRSLIAVFACYGYAALHIIRNWDARTLAPTCLNIFALVYLGLTWLFMIRSDATEIRERAASLERRSRWYRWFVSSESSLTLIVTISLFGLFAALTLLPQTRQTMSGEVVALHALGVVMAWGLLHTAYALFYAYLYYRKTDGEGGLTFPGERNPDYLDFAYIAFTVGTTFAVSDVSVTGRAVRRTVLGHSVLSFGYNTAILAFVLNLALGG